MRTISITETQIMKELWDKGEDLSAQDLHRLLLEHYGKDHKPSTLRTFISRLLEKGYITTYRIGRYSFLRPLVSEDEYKQMIAEQQITEWHNGSLFNFIACFGKKNTLSKTEKEQIRKWIDDMDN